MGKAEGDFKIEGDWVGDNLIRSASFTVEQGEGEIERVAAGKDTVNKLFSKDQERFLEEAINTRIDFDTLQEKQEILELSVKVDRNRAQITWEHFNQFLEQHGINFGGKQAPKTRTALNFFASLIQSSKFL